MPCGAATLKKHVVEVRHVIWIYKIQDVLRVGKTLISKNLVWMLNINKVECIHECVVTGGGHMRRGGRDGLEGPGDEASGGSS
ncbi:hypothetical protein Tco_0363037 [Tanacetum coccineum]